MPCKLAENMPVFSQVFVRLFNIGSAVAIQTDTTTGSLAWCFQAGRWDFRIDVMLFDMMLCLFEKHDNIDVPFVATETAVC